MDGWGPKFSIITGILKQHKISLDPSKIGSSTVSDKIYETKKSSKTCHHRKTLTSAFA